MSDEQVHEALPTDERLGLRPIPPAWKDKPTEWIAHVIGCRDCRTHYAGPLREAFASGLMVVDSADAVVIRREDIPDGLIDTLTGFADARVRPGSHLDSAVRTAARLLSGGGS
jgi:hypothetical protein